MLDARCLRAQEERPLEGYLVPPSNRTAPVGGGTQSNSVASSGQHVNEEGLSGVRAPCLFMSCTWSSVAVVLVGWGITPVSMAVLQ